MKNFLAILFFFIVTFNVTASESIKITQFSNLSYKTLTDNNQSDYAVPHGIANFGFGSTPYFAFKISKQNFSREFLLESKVFGENKLFYPIVLSLDKEFNVIRQSQPIPSVKKIGIYAKALKLTVKIEPNTSFLIVTTNPKLIGKKLNNLEQVSSQVPVYIGNQVYYYQGASTLVNRQYTVSSTAKLEVLTPSLGDAIPLKKQIGFYLSLGNSFGGDTVAYNPDGSNYSAGGGALFGVGYAYHLPASKSYVAKFGAAMRYQGGEGLNSGVILEANINKQFQKINIGTGVYLDLLNSVLDINGSPTNFQNALGLQFIVDYKMLNFINLSLEYVVIDYETDAGIKYNGDHLAVFIKSYF